MSSLLLPDKGKKVREELNRSIAEYGPAGQYLARGLESLEGPESAMITPMITPEVAATFLLGALQTRNIIPSEATKKAINYLVNKIPAKALDKLEGIVTVPRKTMGILNYDYAHPGKETLGLYYRDLNNAFRRLWSWYGLKSKDVIDSFKSHLSEGAFKNPVGKKAIFLREPLDTSERYIKTAAHENTHLLQDLLGTSKDYSTSETVREAIEAEARQAATELSRGWSRGEATPTIDRLIQEFIQQYGP